ncbi:MAG: hypothetical protein JW836_06080 [Deltaproteobacteria bacterium]|nr:hypothetical protein [Deltaproteobacteria bacterium]
MVRGIHRATLMIAVLVLIAAPVSAQFGISSPQPQTAPSGTVLSSGGGRYVFGQVSDSTKDQFMLDTHTGRLWKIGESSDVGTHLRTIPYRDEKGKTCFYPGEVSDARPKEGPKK